MTGRGLPRVFGLGSSEYMASSVSSAKESSPSATMVLTTSVGVRYWPSSFSSTKELVRNWPKYIVQYVQLTGGSQVGEVFSFSILCEAIDQF